MLGNNLSLLFGRPNSDDHMIPSSMIVVIRCEESRLSALLIHEISTLGDHFDKIAIYHTTDIDLSHEGAIYIDIKSNGDNLGNGTTCFVNNHLNINDGIDFERQIHIGFQRHFHSKFEILDIDSQEITAISLGKIRSNNDELEPILRDVNQSYIKLSVLKYSEAPFALNAYPTGLTTEELCQIAKYIGGATKLKSIIIDPDLNDGSSFGQEHKIIALIMWYILEGIQNAESDHPELTKNHNSFIVEVNDHDIEFVRHNQTHRYWAKIKDKYVATTHDEYTQTIDGKVPLRIARLLD